MQRLITSYCQSGGNLFVSGAYVGSDMSGTQGNREFEQTPPAIQLFYRYFKVAGDDKEGEFLSPVEILDYLQKRTTIALSSGKAYHFGRLLQKEGIPCKHTKKGTVYRVVKL